MKKKSKAEQYCRSGHLIFKENCHACRDLKREWYAHAETAGFTDIEKNNQIIDHKTTIDLIYRKDFQTTNQYEAKRTYFQWAEEHLTLSKFKTPKDKMIWEFHSQGVSQRKMSDTVGLEQSWLCRKIKKIEKYLGEQATMIIGSISASQAVYR